MSVQLIAVFAVVLAAICVASVKPLTLGCWANMGASDSLRPGHCFFAIPPAEREH